MNLLSIESRWLAKTLTLVVTVSMLPSLMLFGQQDKLTQFSATTLRVHKTEQQMQSIVTFNFDEDPLSDVIDMLREEHQFNMLLSQNAIDLGVDENKLVTSKLTEVPLCEALEQMLGKMDATYSIKEGIVVIIPKEQREDPEFTRTKLFDCSALIEKMRTPPVRSVANRPSGVSLPSRVKGGGVFSISNSAPTLPQHEGKSRHSAMDQMASAVAKPTPDQIHDSKCERFVHILSNSIEGDVPMQFVDDMLVVNTSESNLRKIDNLLIDLHAAMGLEMPNRLSKVMANQPGRKAQAANPLGAPFMPMPNETKSKAAEPSASRSDDPFANTKNPFGE